MYYTKLTICVLVMKLSQFIPVECTKNIGLTYHYIREGDVFKPVCEHKPVYDVPEGEDVVLNLKKVNTLTFAECTLQQRVSVVTADRFLIVGESDIYQGQLKQVLDGPYNCSFYIPKEAGKQFEPTTIFNNMVYVRISCIFQIKLYRERPILLNVNVNGETLIPSRKSVDNTVTTSYKYDKEQKLMVVCKKDKSANGIVELIIPGVNHQGADTKLPINTAEFQLNQPRTLGPYFTMQCYLHDANNLFELYSIDFAPRRSLNEIDVDGLNVKNIIANDQDNNILSYKYTDIEEVNLKCSMCCANEYCQMEIWYNEKKINYTQWMYNVKIDVSHVLVLTAADNSNVIKCIGYYKPATEILLRTLTINLVDVDNRSRSGESTATSRINRCFNGDEEIKCTNDKPNNPQHLTSTTPPTTIPTTSFTTMLITPLTTLSTNWSASPYIPEDTIASMDYNKNSNKTSIIWSITSALIVMATIVLSVSLVCRRRKTQRPQLPLPESVELNTFPNNSQNNEQPEYEEIPSTNTRPPAAPSPMRHQLRRIPDMKMDRQNGKLIVKGKAIDLKKLLQEAEYEEIK